MVWIVRGCLVAVVALAAGAWAEKVRADEAYVCDAGRVVYVKPGELEIKKLQDPCIAKYFDKVLATKAAATSAIETGSVASAPSRRPVAVTPAVPQSDYRNVRVINAATSADAWFHHRR